MRRRQIAIVTSALTVLVLASAAGGDIVTDWNQTAMSLGPSVGNLRAGRILAMTHTAIYDSYMAFDGTCDPYHVTTTPPTGASPEAAATAAGYQVLHSMYTTEAQRASIQARYDSHLALISDGPGKDAGIAFGQSVAQAIMALRSSDGAMEAMTTPHPDGTLPGEWRRTASGEPMAPGWGNVTPWVMTAGNQFDQGGPTPLTSAEYADNYDYTRVLGGADSVVRTAEQDNIAMFWAEHVPAHWNRLARELAQQEGLSLAQSARLFGLLSVTLADANIAGWNMKYTHNFWRPETAIQLGDSDTNDATVGVADWQPFLVSPAFPEYVSGHSTLSASAATLLELYFGRGDYEFTFMPMNPALQPRRYDSFREAAEEAGMSRIYGGIHFQFSNLDGLEAGDQLAYYAYENCMTPEPATLVFLMAGAALIGRHRRVQAGRSAQGSA